MLAARSPEDAEGMSGVLHIAGAIEKIGESASDIARVVQAKLGIPDVLRPDLRHADEIVGRVRVRPGAPSVGRSLGELLLPSETGMWLLAVRRGSEWEFDPGPDTVLSEGDVLLFQGPEEGVNLIREVAGAPSLPDPPVTEGQPLTELDRAADILVEMNNSAEVAAGVARGRPLAEAASARDRDGDVRPGRAARPALDLPPPAAVRAGGGRPRDLGGTGGGVRGARGAHAGAGPRDRELSERTCSGSE